MRTKNDILEGTLVGKRRLVNRFKLLTKSTNRTHRAYMLDKYRVEIYRLSSKNQKPATRFPS